MLTKVEIIKEKLLDDIHSGYLKKGDAISSRHQFMRRYGCARGTIDRAINELSRDGFLYSRKGAGTYVAGIPVEHDIQRVFIIGGNNLFSEDDFSSHNSLGIISDIQSELPCYLFNNSDINVNMGKISQRGSVVIWSCPPYEQLNTMKYFDKLGVPQLLVGRIYSGFNYVTTDARSGIMEGLRWLISVAGNRDIAFISQTISSDSPYLAERQVAFYESSVEIGMRLKAERLYLSEFNNVSRDISEIGKKLFRDGPCPAGIFLLDIRGALPLISYATACGLEPGRDFHLLIFDEQEALKDFNGVAMLKQHWDKMREAAVNWVWKIRNNRNYRIYEKIKPEIILSSNDRKDCKLWTK